jgi:hypothetical protein
MQGEKKKKAEAVVNKKKKIAITHLEVVSKKFDSRFINSLRNLFISNE